ncbi:MAG TPA: prepilin peptidase [Bryobacteraceae bacterium]|nr:prepilin peptidase [Bryobacteraceae bacterium]
MMQSFPIVLGASLVALVTVAAIYDLRFRRIPNWLNLSGLMLGFALNAVCFHLVGAKNAGEGMLLALAVYLPLYLLRGMGAGDVKLMAAVGALVGPGNWFQIFVATALMGGACAGIFALAKGRLGETLCNLHFLLRDLISFRAPYRTNPQLDFRNSGSLGLPHGVPIALGSFVFLAFVLAGNNTLSTVISKLLAGIFWT